MLFNSFQFLLFFPIVTILYFVIDHKYRWVLLLVASCIFYMAFIPVYIFILFITIIIDYWAGILIEDSKIAKKTKRYLVVSILSTCLVLFIFKYFNFFNANFSLLAKQFHWNYPIGMLNIILPIGLSFHTFQSLSYVIEVYRGKQKAERHFGIYALYVMFYPQLVAGPIERPQNLLHQFYEKHQFEYQRVTDGLKLMAWGLFKKAVIADRIAIYVNTVYGHPSQYLGVPLILATVFFAIQVYCDFSGYSDMAIGAAKVMGFNLMKNFDNPYFSSSVTEYWKRWHISLSTWLRDYIFMPLAIKYRDWGVFGGIIALFITFFISGLWHGASWTFIVWGLLHGMAMSFELITEKTRKKMMKASAIYKYIRVVMTFAFICFTFIFFRAASIQNAVFIVSHLFDGTTQYFQQMIVGDLFNINQNVFLPIGGKFEMIIAIFSLTILIVVQSIQTRGSILMFVNQKPIAFRWGLYLSMTLFIIFFRADAATSFIYFQF